MMDFIREWAFSICITLIATSLFSLLAPKGSMEKILKFTISLFFLNCLVTPFIVNPPKINFDIDQVDPRNESSNYDVVTKTNEQFLSITKKNIEKTLSGILVSNNINCKKIEININISQDKSIFISSIDILLDKSYIMMDNQIKELIKKEVEMEPILIYE